MARRTRRLALPLACLLLLTGLPSGAQVAPQPGPLVVPAGTVLAVTGNLTASSIEVAGTLVRVAPGDLVLSAQSIRLLNGSRVLGWDALRASLAVGAQAAGAPGARGGGVTLHAARVSVDAQALVLAGSGGAGGPAVGWRGARGGDGGAGGSLRVEGPGDALRGQLLPGAGGDGAPAFVGGSAGPAQVRGGSGGASGTLLLNGQPVQRPLPTLAAPAITRTVGVNPTAFCQAFARSVPSLAGMADSCTGGSPGPVLALLQETLDTCRAQNRTSAGCARLLEAPLTSSDVLDVVLGWLRTCTSPGAALIPIDCAALTAKLLGLPDQATGIIGQWLAECSSSDPVSAPCGQRSDLLDALRGAAGVALDQVAAEMAACGVGSAPGRSLVTVQSMDCQGLLNGAGGTVTGLPAFAQSGAPGSPGGTGAGCGQPAGVDGAPNALGDGGRGGDACVAVHGNDGAAGGNGSSGFINCRAGGPGGNGGNSGAAGAVAGSGGAGERNGGAGGHASATSHAGNGGAGGRGGTRWIGENCPGGAGGAGGSSGDSTATGGNGGAGLCGVGGAAGLAEADSHPGSGGVGGAGTPAGPAGVPGVAGASTPKGGEAGVGTGVCPSRLDERSFK
ncbi:MAG: hypothetical protein ABR586_00315 [Thermoplasmatota archaeon]